MTEVVWGVCHAPTLWESVQGPLFGAGLPILVLAWVSYTGFRWTR